MKSILAASILNADFMNLGGEIDNAKDAGVDWIHFDVMDGHFVPNLSIGPGVAESVHKATSLPIDVHLMIDNPDFFINPFIDAGASRISIHIEGNPHVHKSIMKIQENGALPGIVINPGTPIDSISEIIHIVDLVLVMGVNPGFGGQEFIPETLNRIQKVASMIAGINKKIRIQVDGGINKSTAKLAREAGADTFVAGSFIFNNPSGILNAVEQLKSVIKI